MKFKSPPLIAIAVALGLIGSVQAAEIDKTQLIADFVVYKGTPEQYRTETLNTKPYDIKSVSEVKTGSLLSFPIYFANCKVDGQKCDLAAEITVSGPSLKNGKKVYDGVIWNTSISENYLTTGSKITYWEIPKRFLPGKYEVNVTVRDNVSHQNVAMSKDFEIVK